MRSIRLCGVVALLLAVTTAGCKQRCFMTEADFNRTTTTLLEHMETKPNLGGAPITDIVDAPPTLYNLERKIRYMSLAECVAISIEFGRVGQPSLLFPGTALDNLVQFSGGGSLFGGVSGSDAIRVFALQPAVFGNQLEASLAKFDAVFTSSAQWQTTDIPIGAANANIQVGAGNLNAQQTQEATVSTGMVKPLATGGVAGVTFSVPYQYSNLPGNLARVNPSYRPSLQFQFEQPLLQGFGVEINQIRAAHPGSLLNSGVLNTQTASEGILISRIRFDQSRADFERVLNQMLLNVEVAYWNLYGAYWTVYSREQGLRFAYEAFKLNKAKYEAGRAPAADYFQSRGQYELFRAQRLAALDDLLEKERQLRAIMGIPIEDGTRIMPSDSPTLAPYQPDWKAALCEALEKRPELYMIRQEIKANQMRLLLAKNSLMPDLRFTATYDVNSIGTRLDGSSVPTEVRDENGNVTGVKDINAFRGLSENNFNNWSAGLRLIIPIGYRVAYTQMRQAQIDLARTIEVLKDNELKVQSFLANYYRRLSTNYEQIRANRAQREAFGEQLRARQQEFQAGRGTLDILLEAQRFWADALASEYNQIVAYNNALAGFEFAKGTIQGHNNIHIAEGDLPQCAAVRAVDHERQRTAAVVLRERAAPVAVTPSNPIAEMPDGRAVPLPNLMSAVPPIKDAPSLPATMDALRTAPLPAPVEARPEDVFPAPPATLPGVAPTNSLPALPRIPAPVNTPPATIPGPAPVPVAPGPGNKPVTSKPSNFGVLRE